MGINSDWTDEYLENDTMQVGAHVATATDLGSINISEARKLASVQKITSLTPIIFKNAEGVLEVAGNIEMATILGWHVVVKKNLYQVGDLVVYLEIDSVPPDIPLFANDLWPDKEVRPRKLRIKSKKFFQGQVRSQGYVVPIDEVIWGFEDRYFAPGDDLTEELGVTKYESTAAQKSQDIVGEFIDGVPKTDEKRVQSYPQFIDMLMGKPYYITVKLDGKSTTVAMYEDELTVASRNYRLKNDPNNEYWKAVIKTGLPDFISDYPNFAVQGELCGPGIQKNRLELPEKEIFVFDIYDRANDSYLTFEQIVLFAQKYGFKHVPLVDRGDRFYFPLSELLRLAEGKYAGTNNEREGIVIRSREEKPRISFKAISNEFLFNGGE